MEAVSEGTSPTRVFISYAWEDVEYRLLVKRLATRLRYDGIDTRLDAWHLQGLTIPEFMNKEVRHATKILIICSPQYRAKVHAAEDGHTSGVGWEAMLLNSATFSNLLARDKVESVLLRGTWQESAPLFLSGMPYTDLSKPEEFEANYRQLVQKLSGHVELPPPLGDLPSDIDPDPVEPLRGNTALASEKTGLQDTDRFSPPISSFLKNNQYFSTIHSEVRRLTEEQYVVIDFLRHERRVRISGSAGSGKTLVAAEKALRLAKAFSSVLFLCHNPQLAHYVKGSLVAGTTVQVADFGNWVRDIVGAREIRPLSEWTHFDEPDDAALALALESFSSADEKYDAVIIDEGQDFRNEWWAVVEAALKPDGLYYIFHDDNQSLLPRRGSYPNIGPHIDLSRNCRNAGRVFELMRCLARSLPETRLCGGCVLLLPYRSGEEVQSLTKILTEIYRQQRTGHAVVLWAGPEPVDQVPVANCEIVVSEINSWKREVAREFEKVMRKHDPRGLTFPSGGEKWVEDELTHLSDARYPTPEDVSLVQRVAHSFAVSHDVRTTIQQSRKYRRRWHWVGSASDLALQSGVAGATWGAELVLYFERDDWNRGIPEPAFLRITPYYEAKGPGSIPLYGVPDFKGLEADIVILCVRGRTVAHKEIVYVGISRARAMLIVLADESAARVLPSSFHWNHAITP